MKLEKNSVQNKTDPKEVGIVVSEKMLSSWKASLKKTYLSSCAHLSQYLYKTAYEKQKGHYIGCPSAKEDPKLVWAANVLKMQNDRLYKKAYNDHKAKISIPVDMVSINAAKEGQALASNVDYRQYLHQWSCFPDQNDVIQARKAYDLQSDVSVPGKKAFHRSAC